MELVDEVTHGFEPDPSRFDCGTDLHETRPEVLMLLNENTRVALAHPAQGGNQVRLLGFEVGHEGRATLRP